MKRIITCIAILITAFAQTQAQHPRVCDYVSLKRALKGTECEFMRPLSDYYDEDTVVVEHTKEEIRIGTINKYGKAIDSLNIINYKNDTVYIYNEFDLSGMHNFVDIKTCKGAFRISSQENPELFFEPLEMPVFTEQELCDTKTSIYPDIFEWDGLERLIKDRSTEHTADVWCGLTRLILNEYKLIHVDCWASRIFISSLKRDIALDKKYGRKINRPSEFVVLHVYNNINKKNDDDYIAIMYEDENIPPQWIKKGSWAIEIGDYDEKKKYVLYEEPNTRSRKVYKFKEDVLIIYDIVGHWYYVKATNTNRNDCYGWIKLKKVPASFLNADVYK